MLSRPELMEMFWNHTAAIDKWMRKDDWYFWVTMAKGAVSLPVFQNLEAYWPGVLSTVGRNNDALKSIHNYHQVFLQISPLVSIFKWLILKLHLYFVVIVTYEPRKVYISFPGLSTTIILHLLLI